MEPSPDSQKPTRQQQIRRRVFWFIAGAGVNYLLIATPFKWLRTHTQLSIPAVSACSLGVSTTFFFLWNYFVNFRTDARKRDALPRYLAAVALMWALSTTTLSLLKNFNAHLALSLFGHGIDLDIVATQLFLAGLKFPLYHKWAFPLPKTEASEGEEAGGSGKVAAASRR